MCTCISVYVLDKLEWPLALLPRNLGYASEQHLHQQVGKIHGFGIGVAMRCDALVCSVRRHDCGWMGFGLASVAEINEGNACLAWPVCPKSMKVMLVDDTLFIEGVIEMPSLNL